MDHFSFQYYLELLGTLVFAISGSLAVKDENRDWIGAGFTGFITAIGGGTLRDVLLDSYPLSWISDIYIVYTIFFGIVLAFVFTNFLSKLRKTFLLFDSLGIGLFAILGTEKALLFGVRPEIAILMGMFSAVMGGVLRDTIIQKTPTIFRKEIYASACLAGGLLFVLLNFLEVDRNLNIVVSVSFVISTRLLAVKYKLSLPGFKESRKS